jgi:DNA-binding SARP family transcriptional activator/predicted ATPase
LAAELDLVHHFLSVLGHMTRFATSLRHGGRIPVDFRSDFDRGTFEAVSAAGRGEMEFRILGPLEVCDGGRVLPLGGGKQRCLLGVLLLHANEAISSERLVDELWGTRPPARAAKLVQGYVSGLRKALGAHRLETRPPGYLVRLDGGELDLDEFERLAADARSEPDAARAADRWRAALSLWRGPALADLRFEGFASREAERLNELRLAALLERIEADLALGRHAQLVGELEALVAEHPLQERLRGRLMLALYRSGRQAEALEVYRATRSLLAEELGLEPSHELQRIERLVLTQGPELDLPEPPVAEPPEPEPPPVERRERVRRLVTVVFAELAGAAALGERLDPESLHDVLARYAETCAEVIEHHGGTVERFAGDAVVAVFGFPEAHEDDAWRAVCAATEVRGAVDRLGLEVKAGVNSGEVFVGLGSRREAFASGDALNLAAGLATSAAAGEILLGEQTRSLVGDAVVVETLEPVAVEGRSNPVAASRLLELRPELALLRPPTTPFVDRERELPELAQEFRRTTSDRACRLCTVLGAPGIGKSRIVRELLEALSGAATIAVGRCLSYGEGITYRPLAEIVRGLAGGEPIADLLRGVADAELVAERVLGAIGQAEPGGREETFWAVRRLFETVARAQPLVVVVEDVHWAQPTPLDLLEYLVGFSSGSPILLVCLARPELLEARPEWAAPQQDRSLVVLDRLPDHDARELVASLGAALDDRSRARIVETGEGNPLFLEQLVAVQADAEAETLPPTVQAVLAARIDRLEPGERSTLQLASVEGRSFHRGLLEKLLPGGGRGELESRLMGLVRKQLIRADPPRFEGEDAFRFTHVLTREAAYAALPKQLRAELHERVADWIEAKPKPASEDGIVGYHLERAFRYRRELGTLERGDDLGSRAAARLEAAGREALARSDLPAAANLLERAVALLPEEDPQRAALLPELGGTLMEAGELRQAEAVLEEARRAAAALGDERLAANALVRQLQLRLQITTDATAEAAAIARQVLPVLERHGDVLGTYHARRLEAWVHWIRGNVGAAQAAWEEAAEHARRAGATREEAEVLLWLASAALSGPMPASDAVARCEQLVARLAHRPTTAALVHNSLAALQAMLGRFDEAHALLERARTVVAYFAIAWGASSHSVALVAMLADDYEEAERSLRVDYDYFSTRGEKGFLSTTAALLARAVEAQARHDEAYELTKVAERSGASDDLTTQIVWRSVRARVLAETGDGAIAERLAREAVALAAQTDRLSYHGDALVDLAAVLGRLGRLDEEREVLGAAAALYERKENRVAVARVQATLGNDAAA